MLEVACNHEVQGFVQLIVTCVVGYFGYSKKLLVIQWPYNLLEIFQASEN